jgi:hypothetical protein
MLQGLDAAGLYHVRKLRAKVFRSPAVVIGLRYCSIERARFAINTVLFADLIDIAVGPLSKDQVVGDLRRLSHGAHSIILYLQMFLAALVP